MSDETQFCRQLHQRYENRTAQDFLRPIQWIEGGFVAQLPAGFTINGMISLLR